MKLIILVKPHAQLSNQLIQNMHFDAYCFENSAIFLNHKFYNLSKTVDQYRYKPFLFILGRILVLDLVRKILLKLSLASYKKFYAPNFQDSFDISKITYVKGWYFRNSVTLNNNKYFYINRFNSFLIKEELFEKKSKILLGVHIRRGDYIHFLGGNYFLTDDEYIEALLNVTRDIHDKFKVIIFGNDPDLNMKKYKDLGLDLTISGGSIYQDYYRLSKCDYVIGPTSTFTMWSQFISNGQMKKIVLDKFNYQKVSLYDAS